nr:uncharacterized protein LOC132767750 [Anolis sagrei ordinatus]
MAGKSINLREKYFWRKPEGRGLEARESVRPEAPLSDAREGEWAAELGRRPSFRPEASGGRLPLAAGLEALLPAEAWRSVRTAAVETMWAVVPAVALPPAPFPLLFQPAAPFPRTFRPLEPPPKPTRPAAPSPEPAQPRCLSYANYDEPRYSRLLVVLKGKYRFPARHFASFGGIEEVWSVLSGNLCHPRRNPRGPVFVKYARTSQALRALEDSAHVTAVAQIYLAQNRVPGSRHELDVDLRKLTVIHVTIPRIFTKNVLENTFKVYGAIVSCSIIKNKVGESTDSAFIRFLKASEAALAIEECDKSFQAVWAADNPDLPIPPDLKFGVFGAQQGITKHEIQGATLNTMCKNTSLANEPSKVSESKSPVNNPKEKTTCKEVQESSVDTLGKSTSEANVVTEPSKLSTSKCDVNNSTPKTTNNEIEKSSVNTSGKCTKPEQQTTSSSMICTEKKTISSEMQWSNLIPVVSRTTSNVPVTRTESEPGHAVQNAITCRITGSNLIVSGSSSRSNFEQKGSRPCRSNLITLSSADNTTSSEPATKAFNSSVNYWVNRTEKKKNFTSATESNLITLGIQSSLGTQHCPDYRFSAVQQVFNPPEHHGYAYYADGTNYSAALSEPSMQPPGTNLDYYYISGVEQQTDNHSVKESNLMSSGYSTLLPVSVTQPLEPIVCPIYESAAEPEVKVAEVQQDTVLTTEKSLKSSEWKFYMGGARRKKGSRGNSLLTSVDPPDLASVKRSNSRKQESISRHLLMVSEFPLTQEQIFGLFDVIPGLESCEARPGLRSTRVYAMIQYRHVASAVYAKRRLHGLEHPLGNQLHITYIEDNMHGIELLQEMATQLVTSQLASLIWDNNWAPHLLRSAESWIPPPCIQTDAVLPSYKRKAPPDSSIRERLLIIFDPRPLPQNILDNLLSRFENFIASCLIPGKNGAYAMFAERASASDAIATLHGKTVNDVKLKVTLSDLPTEDFSKRQRLF